MQKDIMDLTEKSTNYAMSTNGNNMNERQHLLNEESARNRTAE